MVLTQAVSLTAQQFFQGLIRCPAATTPGLRNCATSPAAVNTAAQQLLAIMRTLCVPDSGWPVNQPQTPANLLPYASDEAEELLETLHQWQRENSSKTTLIPALEQPHLQLVAGFSAELLWAIAASAPDIMQLLEGKSTHFRGVNTENIRLIPVLTVKLDKTAYTFDLAMQSAVQPDLAIADIASDWLSRVSPCTAYETLQQQVWQQVTTNVPHLQLWREGQTLPLLLPGQSWTTVHVILHLELAALNPLRKTAQPAKGSTQLTMPLRSPLDSGIPHPQIWLSEPSVSTFNQLPVAIASNEPFFREADVSFLESTDLETVSAQAEAIDFSRRLNDWSNLEEAEMTAIALVAAAHEFICSDRQVVGAFARSPLTLMELCQQLRWLWVRASQDCLPLMAGLAARWLPPGKGWRTGSVVSVGRLHLQSAANNQASLDIASGEWISERSQLSHDHIVQLLTSSGLSHSCWTVGELETYLQQTLQQRSPLLNYFMAGTSIALTSPCDELFPQAKPPHLRLNLQISIEFI